MRSGAKSGGARCAIVLGLVWAVGTAGGASEAWARGGSQLSNGELTLEVNYQYPPTAADIDLLKEQMDRANMILCDATEREVRITKVRVTGGALAQETGDIWLLPADARSYSGDRIILFHSAVRGDVIGHELGHYVLGLGDSYPEERRYGGCGQGPSFDVDFQLDDVWNSLMQQHRAMACVNAAGQSHYDLNPRDWRQLRCLRDSDCAPWPGFTCPDPSLMSELSVASNNDLRSGSGWDRCPEPRGAELLIVGADLDEAEPMVTPHHGKQGKNCGNGAVDGGEQCDYNFRTGTRVVTESCGSLGYSGGVLGCHPNCSFDMSSCTTPPSCGNGALDSGEACEPGLTISKTCADLGFTGWQAGDPALLGCNSNCTFDTRNCPGVAVPFGADSLDLARSTSRAIEFVEAIDRLGRVEGNGALLKGQSSHLIYLFLDHDDWYQWTLYLYGRAGEYEGYDGPDADKLLPLGQAKLDFRQAPCNPEWSCGSPDLVKVNGVPVGFHADDPREQRSVLSGHVRHGAVR